MTFYKSKLVAGFLAMTIFGVTSSLSADNYKFDPSHAQIIFSYDHFGFSTTYGMFSGFDGTATIDADNIANSSVSLEIQIGDMLTGWEGRDGHFLSGDFFNVEQFPVATFQSTSVEAAGDMSAIITGDLTILDQTKSITLDAKLNKMGKNPITQKDWAGFSATTTLMRSDFNLGKYAPAVGDEVNLIIEVELEKLDG